MMTERVFLVTAGKMTSFIIDENIIKFSSHKATSLVDFHEAWNKKITLAKKHEVKLDSIRSIKKRKMMMMLQLSTKFCRDQFCYGAKFSRAQ
ncbi:MAG: hypothetical protein IPI50_07890 [Saprospiraceae bacterium]|nr:hypothetical protein [Saprospiraceae bacterium]